MMPGWGTVMVGEQFWRRGENGGAASLSQLLLYCLSVPLSQETIPTVSLNIGGALFLVTIDSYLTSVSFIALLLSSFSERPPSLWQNASHSECLKVDRLQFVGGGWVV